MATQAASASGLAPSVQIPVAQPPKVKLNPYIVMMPDTSHETWATVWYVASIVTLVAFVVFATLAILLTGIYDPVFLPVVTAFSLRLIDDVWSVHRYFNGLVEEENFQAEIEARVENHLKQLPATAKELETYLTPMPIRYTAQLPKSEDLVSRRPALARLFAWIDQQDFFERSADRLLEIGAQQPEKLQESRLEALKKRELALASKMMAAYMRTLLLNPYLPHDWRDLFDVSAWKKPLEVRLCNEALLARYQPTQKHEEIFVTFKRPSKTPALTTAQVHEMTAGEIAAILSGISTG